ncbi:glycosyltransferase domain-containing protein [Tabrizicola fusiformis]|uniref:glycosyltransferase domain-containing protein n=1 Tax=Tabrizicola sp. SY72 TaxID=2741673 RepID=UPI00157248FE|nr:glycosyltransferase domain-containing protein [Tabrizicola sp. SY72]NTT86637.1 DUF616 domain-containing protein [Tabrizicola sp. SY72]
MSAPLSLVDRGLPPGARQRPQAGGKIALISCHFGQHEPFNPAAAATTQDGVEALVFTDRPGLPLAPGTRAVLLPSDPMGPALQSRLPKLCPHLFLEGFDWVIYIDNNARLLHSPARIVHKIGKEFPERPAGRYFFRHRRRDCAWDEADECLRLGYMTPAQHDHVMATFTQAGFPRRAGLYANTCLVQHMGSPATDVLNEAWFHSLTSHTRRDQVMLPFLLWQAALPHHAVKPKIKDWADWPVFSEAERTRYRAAAARLTA